MSIRYNQAPVSQTALITAQGTSPVTITKPNPRSREETETIKPQDHNKKLIREDKQKEPRSAIVETGKPKHKKFEEHKSEARRHKQDGNYIRDKQNEPETNRNGLVMINIVNHNTTIFKHLISLLKGDTPTSVNGTLENGETFEHAHKQTCQELESTIPNKMKREALVTLMGKTGCPLWVIIIKEKPHLYKAVFPHFIMHSQHQDNFTYRHT